MAGEPSTDAGQSTVREERTLLAATLSSGPAEFLDFVLPLWAGIALCASATQVGVLLALELAVSVAARPIAGVLADTRERRYVAAAGAALYGISCAGYALATSISVAYGAAAVGGIGGALLRVAVGAIVGERLEEDSAVYPRLLSAEETGAWIAFIAGLSLLNVIDFRGVFLACAAACAAAAVVLLGSPSRPAFASWESGSGTAGIGSGRWAAGSGRCCSRSR